MIITVTDTQLRILSSVDQIKDKDIITPGVMIFIGTLGKQEFYPVVPRSRDKNRRLVHTYLNM